MDLISNIAKLFTQRKEEVNNTNWLQFARIKEGKKVVAQLVQQTQSLTKKDIGTWREAWQIAINIDNPKRALLYDIYTDCLVDLHLIGCIGQRKGKTLQKKFRLIGTDGKESELTNLLNKEWFYDFVDYALDARFWGHTLIQLGDVITDDNGEMRFREVQVVPRKHVVPEHQVIIKEASDDWQAGISYIDGDFANWCIEVGKSHDLGLLLKCAPSCLSKKNMLAFWDMFGEVFGAPLRIARTNTNDESERRRLEATMEQMGAVSWGVLSDGTDIEIKESSRGDAYNVYDRRVDRCNSEISKGILMQTMTIDSGSSYSQSETHLEIFEDVVASDARHIACVINDKLLPLMIKHGFPVKGLHFEWDNAATFTPAEQREMERLLLDHYEINPQYFIDKYNINITGVRTKQADPNNFFA